MIITGAGRGLGRAHALLFASEGAKVLVNDLGGDLRGDGPDRTPAQQVVDEILALGGEAVANTDNVADWEGSAHMIEQAVEVFGDLHVLVNNAGIVRDRFLVNMAESEWDAVINVNLKGHFCPTRHAAAYWREKSKFGDLIDRSIIHTTSGSGLFGNAGQTNYGAAKTAVASLSQIAAQELGRFGVRSNAIAPSARTRMTLQTPGVADKIVAPGDATFDFWDPANVSPFLGYLATADCPYTGETFHVGGGRVTRIRSWSAAEQITKEDRWTIEELIDQGPQLAGSGGERPVLPL